MRSAAIVPGLTDSEIVVLVFTGVAGSGKTTVGAILASQLGWPFEEGDTLHPRANIEKMRAGHPLTDQDRAPWLARIAAWVSARLDAGENGIITCSALKRAYRDVINRRGRGVVFVFLTGPSATIAARLAARHGHFMAAEMLASQLEDLEPPQPDEPAITFDVGPSPRVIAQEIIESLRLNDPGLK